MVLRSERVLQVRHRINFYDVHSILTMGDKKQASNASKVHSYKIEKVYTIYLNVKYLFYIGIQQTFSQGHNWVCCNFFFIIYVQPRICYNWTFEYVIIHNKGCRIQS